ncbi:MULTISPECIES: DUF3592 domain-containing protein [unclassified Streptomyces]|jgi:hypothetical protein|uniref:DUF3592 domain-containing protein n=1 Tax=unclassified Streptomyces TaxID=2593676 RepID=UPI000F4F5F5D|nr:MULTISPECIES: DUF3592 domain-containing protein [unclassified Streptomyces]MDH6450438.1 hypothetical protein [Streptomyces sp. SAI-119]MDH6499018.1 hypothetical protein [Streptomyces sp. SAI-149]QUC62223.1 hypothetical protein IOD14_38650 [Streptomyces sp. A2-16]GLP65572.1 hypothetical protein TUSST3_21920 [Streptomyces sp. TUS-ST3]
MGAFFYLVPGLIMAVALFGAYLMVRRWLRMRRAWRSGLTAEAECLRVYAMAHGGGDTRVRTSLRHVYEFRTREGRVVRFEEEGGPGTTLEGDIVTVHYADGPDVVATARPGRGGHGCAACAVLAFAGLVVLVCGGFMVAFAAMS